MGLFEKKYCDLCGDKVNALTRQKLNDGFLCSDCKHKLSCLTHGWKNRSIEDVKLHLEQRKQNKAKYAAFSRSASAGSNEMLVVDFQKRQFYFAMDRDYKEGNPEVFDFSQLQNFWIELGYTSLSDSDHDGIPDSVDHYDNDREHGAFSGFVNTFANQQNTMLDVPLALQQYVKDNGSFSSSPRRISSLKAKFVVNHPFITEVTMNIDAFIGENRNELMRAFENAMGIVQLYEQMRNAMGYPQGGMPVQNGMGYPQGGMPVQNGMGYQQGGMPMQNGMGYQQGGMPVQNGMGYPQGGMPAQQQYAQQAGSVVCQSCGWSSENAGNVPKFCPNCGSPLVG